MTDLKHNFIRLKEELALNGEEHAALRTLLVARMEAKTVEGGLTSPYVRYFTMSFVSRTLAAGMLILVLAGGGGSVLAHSALPGDTLYVVKLTVNEPLERSFAATPEAKAVVDIKHAEERLAEVELLAAEGTADETALQTATLAVETKVARAVATAEKLSLEGEEADADSIRSELSARLRAHADILDAQAEDLDEEKKRGLRSLSFAVAKTLSDSDEAHAAEPARSDVVTERREAFVARQIQKLEQFLADTTTLPSETLLELDAELAAIQRDYGETRERAVEGMHDEASASYQELARRVSRALAIAQSAERIEDVTGKEVVVTFGFKEEPTEAPTVMAKTAAPVPQEEATSLMMVTSEVAPVDDSADFSPEERTYDRPFRFLIRETGD